MTQEEKRDLIEVAVTAWRYVVAPSVAVRQYTVDQGINITPSDLSDVLIAAHGEIEKLRRER
jgi:hypothetical protein